MGMSKFSRRDRSKDPPIRKATPEEIREDRILMIMVVIGIAIFVGLYWLLGYLGAIK
jgi:hypothetical protein